MFVLPGVYTTVFDNGGGGYVVQLSPGGQFLFFVDVRSYAGADLGAKLQAANDSYGDTPALLYVSSSGSTTNNTFATAVTFNANKTVWLGCGTYPVRIPDLTIMFKFRDYFNFRGDGWNTIIEQPTGMVLLAPYNNAVVSNDGPGANFWTVCDFQVIAPFAPRSSTGGETVIGTGNSKNVAIRNVLFNGCWGIDITLGGTSNLYAGTNHHGEQILVEGCYHIWGGVDDQIKFAPVNAKNWQAVDCQYLNGANVDAEQNVNTDDVSGWLFSGCLFQRGTLQIQGPQVRNGNISGCTFHGEGQGTIAVNLLGPIGVTVQKNVIDGYNGGDTVESGGITVNSAINCTLDGNTITNCSIPSATPNTQNNAPITIIKSLNTEIKNNRIESPLHGWSGIHEDVNSVNTTLKDNFFGYGSGSVINLTTTTDIPRYAPVSSQSIGQSLPQSTIYSPLARYAIAPGTFTIQTFNGTAMTTQTVSFTGVTNTSFTGCTGGTGQMILGALPDISLLGTNVREFNTTYATADGYETLRKDGPKFQGRRTVSSSTSLVISDRIIGVDSSAGAVTLSLPNPTTAAAYNASWTVDIQDEGGAAATHNITIHRFGTEKIAGVAADYVISTNGKGVQLYSNGTDWFVR